MTKGIFTEGDRTATYKAQVQFEKKANNTLVNSDLLFNSSKNRELENKSATLNKTAE